ncbi:MAG: hypothetical protein ABI137_12795 [Antricoccus sp.]
MVESDTYRIDVLTQVSAATKELQSVAAAESVSQHPIARSIVEAAAGHQASIEFQTADGLGASAIVDGHRAFVGRRQFLVQHGQRAGIQMPSRAAGTLVAVGWDCAICGHRSGRLLPARKVRVVEDSKAGGHRVAMVGDGLKEVAALATADLGIAMSNGADAGQSAQVISPYP